MLLKVGNRQCIMFTPMMRQADDETRVIAADLEESSPTPTQKRGRGRPPGTGRKQQSASLGMPSGEPVKRKRGRPFKHGLNGSVLLGLSPISLTPSVPSSLAPTQKRGRGRPPGTGRKQQSASLGMPSGEPVKRKRSRPRKNRPDGAGSLGLYPVSSTPAPSSLAPTQIRGRGHPPGTGTKKKLASLGTTGASSGEASVECLGEGEEPMGIINSDDEIRMPAVDLDQSGPLLVIGEARDSIMQETSPLCFPKVTQPSTQAQEKTVCAESEALLKRPTTVVSNEKLDSGPFGSSDALLSQSGSGGAVISNGPPEFNVLYQKIAARYGRLNGDLPSYLPQTYAAMTNELLKTIYVMMQTKPSDLSIFIVSQWEKIVQFAADAKFNVDWLSSILANMRATAELVERRGPVVQNLIKEVESSRERLNQARWVVKGLEKEVDVACSELDTLEGCPVSTNFFDDLE